MKIRLVIIVLGLLLTSCSLDNSEKAITNCADHEYSKRNMSNFPKNYRELMKKNIKPKNNFEKTLVTLNQAGFDDFEIFQWIRELQKDEIDSKTTPKRKEDITFAKNIIKDNKAVIKKFISLNLNTKLQREDYEIFFQSCEYERKRTPKTFDAKWAKSNLVY